jgi:hypothetical protein
MRKTIVSCWLACLAPSLAAGAAPDEIVGTWALDEAKSKAAADGNTAGLMAKLSINPDGTFAALHGITGTWERAGGILFVTYAIASYENAPAKMHGAYLKFPAPSSPKTKFCYMKKVSDQPSIKAVAPEPYVRPSRAPTAAPARPAPAPPRAAAAVPPAAPAAPVDLGRADPKVAETLTKWIGTSKDGWTPAIFGRLRSGMSPADVAKVFTGADKVSQYGFAELRVGTGLPHVTLLSFSYQEQKKGGPLGLYSLTLTFEPSFLSNKESYAALVNVCEAKFGPIKEREKIPQMTVTWAGYTQGDLRTAQLFKLGQDLQLSFDFADR